MMSLREVTLRLRAEGTEKASSAINEITNQIRKLTTISIPRAEAKKDLIESSGLGGPALFKAVDNWKRLVDLRDRLLSTQGKLSLAEEAGVRHARDLARIEDGARGRDAQAKRQMAVDKAESQAWAMWNRDVERNDALYRKKTATTEKWANKIVEDSDKARRKDADSLARWVAKADTEEERAKKRSEERAKDAITKKDAARLGGAFVLGRSVGGLAGSMMRDEKAGQAMSSIAEGFLLGGPMTGGITAGITVMGEYFRNAWEGAIKARDATMQFAAAVRESVNEAANGAVEMGSMTEYGRSLQKQRDQRLNMAAKIETDYRKQLSDTSVWSLMLTAVEGYKNTGDWSAEGRGQTGFGRSLAVAGMQKAFEKNAADRLRGYIAREADVAARQEAGQFRDESGMSAARMYGRPGAERERMVMEAGLTMKKNNLDRQQELQRNQANMAIEEATAQRNNAADAMRLLVERKAGQAEMADAADAMKAANEKLQDAEKARDSMYARHGIEQRRMDMDRDEARKLREEKVAIEKENVLAKFMPQEAALAHRRRMQQAKDLGIGGQELANLEKQSLMHDYIVKGRMAQLDFAERTLLYSQKEADIQRMMAENPIARSNTWEGAVARQGIRNAAEANELNRRGAEAFGFQQQIKLSGVEMEVLRGHMTKLDAAFATLKILNPRADDKMLWEVAETQRQLELAKNPWMRGEAATGYQYGDINRFSRVVLPDDKAVAHAGETNNILNNILQQMRKIMPLN